MGSWWILAVAWMSGVGAHKAEQTEVEKWVPSERANEEQAEKLWLSLEVHSWVPGGRVGGTQSQRSLWHWFVAETAEVQRWVPGVGLCTGHSSGCCGTGWWWRQQRC